MIYGIVGKDVPIQHAYAIPINKACGELGFSPLVAYAVANRETIRGERQGQWNASKVISGDGGFGLLQLTSWVPDNWQDPYTNAHWAVVRWLLPSMHHYAVNHSLSGDQLIIAIADAFNAGEGRVCKACEQGQSLDSVTTGGNYGKDVLTCYHALLSGNPPT